jgi:hypothetical protein
MPKLYNLNKKEIATIIFALEWFAANIDEVKEYFKDDDEVLEEQFLLGGDDAQFLADDLRNYRRIVSSDDEKATED